MNKLISETMSDGIWTIDNNHVCTYINEAALRMIGYTSEQCIGKNMHELVHHKYPSGSYYPESECPICKTFFSQESNTVDDEVFWKSDGSQLPVRYTSNPIITDNELIGVLVLFSDISNLKDKDAEILKIKINQDNLLNATEDFIWSVDTERRLISFNKAYAHRISTTTGRPVKEGELAIEKEFGIEIVTKWEGYYKKALSGVSFKITEQIYDPVLNSVEYDLISFVPMYNGAKEVYGVACSAKDITEEVNRRISIADTYSDLENIFNQSMDIICTINEEGRFIKLSPACLKIWGYRPEELVGKLYIDIVHPEDVPETNNAAKDNMNGEELTHFENRYINKSGQTVPMLWSAKWDSKAKTMYCVARDNTEKKIAEKKLAESERLLKEAQRLAKMGSWEFDFKTDKLTWSDELYNIFHTDKDTFLETHGSFIHLIDESDRQYVLDTSKHTQETGEPFNIQYRITTVQGEKRIIEEYGYGVKDSEGNITRLFGTAQDITLRRQNEIALSLSEARFRVIVESQTNYILRTDLKGNYTYCNQKFIDDFGWLYPNNELIGASGKVSIMPYHHENAESTVKKCFSSPNQVFQVEIDKPAQNGGVKTTLWDFILLTDVDDHPAEMQCAGIDITDRKKAEAKIEEANQRFELATKATFEAIWDWDVIENTFYWGDGFELLLGYNIHGLQKDPSSWTDNIHPDDFQRVMEGVDAIINGTAANWLDEYRFRKNDQTYAYVLDKGVVIRDGHGKAVRMVGAIQDVTKKKEEELRLRLLESVITNTNDAVLITEAEPFDEPGPRILYVNNAFTKMTGYTAEEVIGKTPRMLQGPKSDKNELHELGEKLRNWEPYEITTLNYKKNGDEFWNNFTVSPVANDSGWFTHWIAIERDVTDAKNTEIQLLLLNESLQKQANDLAISNAELEQFAFIASHDLQEPLRMVTSFLTQLEKKYYEQIDEKGKQYIYFAVDGAKRMRQIILDLLEYSRVGRIDANYEKVNTEDVINDVRALYKSNIEETAAVITVNRLPTVYTDKALLRQTFQNLIGNALKYQNKGVQPEISISCEDKSDYWLFSVTDNGIGIDAEYFDQIFIIFKRLHSRDEYAGNGMGLAITKKIVENMSGKIWVVSEKDKGSTFYFTIPKK